MKTIITVKQEHINEGKFRSPYSCPIAKALKEKQILFHGVTQEGIDFTTSFADDTRVALPDEAIQFINDFDEHIPVKPFEFEINIPEQYLKA